MCTDSIRIQELMDILYSCVNVIFRKCLSMVTELTWNKNKYIKYNDWWNNETKKELIKLYHENGKNTFYLLEENELDKKFKQVQNENTNKVLYDEMDELKSDTTFVTRITFILKFVYFRNDTKME